MDTFSITGSALARLLPRLQGIAHVAARLSRRPRSSAQEQHEQAGVECLSGNADAQQETAWHVQPEPDDETSPEEAAATDPVAIAARVMVEHALVDPALRAAAFAPSSLIIIEVPSSDWLRPIHAAWHDASGRTVPPLRPDEGDHLTLSRLREKGNAVVFLRDDRNTRTKDRGNDDLATAVHAGVPVVGFSPAPDRTLPAELLAGADLRLVIPSPGWAVVAAVAERIGGAAPMLPLPHAHWERASALALRLAVRRARSADDYVAALASLLPRSARSRAAESLADLPGMGEAAEWARTVLRDVTEIRSGRVGWAAMDRGAVLVGPPGTGKTSLVRALAADTGMTLVATSYAAWQSAGEGYLGDVMRSMRGAFDEARKSAPAILFIDELDTLGSRQASSILGRGGKRDDWWRAVINGLLEAMDGALSLEGVLVIGATNDIEGLDPALLRAGRLERHIRVPLPDAEALTAIFRVHLGEDLVAINLSTLAAAALGASGADAERWVRAARRRARHANRPMQLDDLRQEALGGGQAGRSDDWARVVATHEAGHCVAMSCLRPGSVTRATMSAAGNAEASTVSLHTDRQGISESWLEAELVIRLAGRAAELEVLGKVTAGSGGTIGSDLGFATWLAVVAEDALGLGETLVWRGMPDTDAISSLLAMRPSLEARVTLRLDAAYRHARQLVRDHQGAVVAVADALIERGALMGSEIEALIHGERLP